MNELQIFKNDEFGEVRTVEINGEPWFVGTNIIDNLGYQNGSRDINRHVDKEDRQVVTLHDGTQNRLYTIINESGLYALILGSKLSSAKKFKHWVTSEVLPTIRKTGGYHLPQTYAEALRELADLSEEKERMATEMIAMNEKIEEMQPKVTYLDTILESKKTVLVTQIAQDYGMSARSFNKMLHDLSVQHKVNGQWILYSKYQGQGYVHSRTHSFEYSDGRTGISENTEWTQKGRLFLYEFLKAHDVLPLIEVENA